jgi:beta-galactosidase
LLKQKIRLEWKGKIFKVTFSRSQGTIVAYQHRGQNLIQTGPMENYYRAPTDIDLLMGNPPASIHKWRAAGIDRLERWSSIAPLPAQMQK